MEYRLISVYTRHLILNGLCTFRTDLTWHVCTDVPIMLSAGLQRFQDRLYSVSSNINDQHSSLTATSNSSITLVLSSSLTGNALTSKGDDPSSKWDPINLMLNFILRTVALSKAAGAVWSRTEKTERVMCATMCVTLCVCVRWYPSGHILLL